MNIDDFRSFMIRELTRRQKRNPAYTLSAFARDLQMSSQKLGQVFNGRSGLSPAAADDVARLMNLQDNEKDLFIALVAATHSRSAIAKAAALDRVKAIRARQEFKTVDQDELPISHWYHWAALLLVDRKDFHPDMDWVADQLQITPDIAIAAYETLFANNLLERDADGNWHRTKQHIHFHAKTSTTEIRRFHADIIDRAKDSIENKPVSERSFSTAIIPIAESDRAEINRRIEEFIKGLAADFTPDDRPVDRVSAVSIQLFPLDKSSS